MNRTFAAALSGMVLIAAPASAQLPQASSAALGLGFNMTAASYGFSAVANNPAGLAHPNSPAFSLAIPSIIGEAGVGPVTLAELKEWEERVVPDNVKDDWIQRIAASGQAVSLSGGLTPFALNVGPIGFQLSTTVGGRASLNDDAAELLMYGNAGRSGSADDFDLEGSAIDGFVLTTGAVSLGMQTSPGLYLGGTLKYTVGNALALGRDGGTMLNSSPVSVDVDFPMIVNRTEDGTINNGSGIGFDVGAIWVGEGLTLGATIENLFNTFEWSLDGLSYVPGQAVFDLTESTSDFDEQPASMAPSDLLAQVAEQTIKPAFSVGAALEASPMLHLRADIRKRSSEGLQLGPEFHAGVGAELRVLPILPLRAHVAKVTGGSQIGGGLSLVLGPVNLSGGIAVRTQEAENSTLGMFTLSFGAN